MSILEICFWLLAAVVAYAYLAYPLLLALLTSLSRRPVNRGAVSGSVSVVIAAYNEEATVGRRVREFLDAFQRMGLTGELIVVSDGSTDRTAQAAREAALQDPACRVIELSANAGKAVALTAGAEAARNDIVVFADARQTWAPDALVRLMENFADPAVGAVSGDLVVRSAAGVMQGVGFYWRYEKWLRRRESELWSMVGATGAISAVRRALFRPLPPQTILDDVYWPMQVAVQGFRVIHDERALAFDRLPERARDEFRRKVRTLSGNFQLVARLPTLLLPGRNPIWVQFVSHKLLRLVVPWALLALLAINLRLGRPVYWTTLVAQAAGYAIGLLGMLHAVGSRSRIAAAAASFLVLNAAAWCAFWVWVFGRSARSWTKTAYNVIPTAAKST